jgi:hypothetical protein
MRITLYSQKRIISIITLLTAAVKINSGGDSMPGKKTKKIVVNVKALNQYLKERNLDYRDLSEQTGMSLTQAFNLSKKSIGGAATLAYIASLEAPGLLYLVTYEENENRKKVVEVKSLTFYLK